MSHRQKQQFIVEGANLTSGFGSGTISSLLENSVNSNFNNFTGGTYEIYDGIGRVTHGSGFGMTHSLPVGYYTFDLIIVIEQNSTGNGNQLRIFNQTGGTIPAMTGDKSSTVFSDNTTINRSFTEYSIGSSDYISNRISFDLEVTQANQTGMVLAYKRNGNSPDFSSVPYFKLVITKVDWGKKNE